MNIHYQFCDIHHAVSDNSVPAPDLRGTERHHCGMGPPSGLPDRIDVSGPFLDALAVNEVGVVSLSRISDLF